VRKLPSGRFQARYRVDLTWRAAPTTFRTKREADAFLAQTRADLDRGSWLDPARGDIALGEYSARWLADRPSLRPRTKELYEGLLRLHILPTFGERPLARITTAGVRTWRARMLAADRPGPSTVSKSYRLLHAIMATAVEDGVVPRNPCLIRGASVERPAERPIATVAEVYRIADAIEPRLRAMVLLATFAGLRLGELRALRRQHLDLDGLMVQVVEQYQELADGSLVLGPPKTDAGRRTVSLPAALGREFGDHLDRFVADESDALVFANRNGTPLRRATFYTAWAHALRAAGIEGLHFHDLRHTGNTLAATTGASTKELMARMGHASPRAALIYQHATQDRDAVIAKALSDLIESRVRSEGDATSQRSA
jgi:integrase